ncbi:MAG: DUF1295 domain-containing protein [Candidatus Absconditabacteria bacterium]
MGLVIILFFLYVSLFIISIRIKDNSIVDIFWGIGFVIISLYYFIQFDYSLYKLLILLLIGFWGCRLAYYILQRKLKDPKEDYRYAVWRKEWNNFYLRSFFQVYILQMILMLIVSLPLYYVFLSESLNIYYYLIGIIVSIVGLTIEIIADSQVKNYILQYGKTNKVYTGGLYKYTRNPNYFGESMFWLGISIIGMGESIISVVGFITITFLLVFVSGVPLKEKRQSTKENRKEYKNSTSIFIPWKKF